MFYASRITWEKLKHELDLFTQEEPISLAPFLIGLNSFIKGEPDNHHFFKELNYLSFELEQLCESDNEEERVDKLNHFFFQLKSFQILHQDNDELTQDSLLAESVLTQKRGAPLVISLIYTHLAQHLNLPIYLINHPQMCIAKWVRPGSSKFIDLTRGGKVLNESQVLNFFNRIKNNSKIEIPYLDPLKAKDILELYLNQLLKTFNKNNRLNPQHILLNLLNQLRPTNLKYISLRALIRKSLGLNKEAIDDLKKYFSFSGKTRAPKNLKMAYYELQALKEDQTQNKPTQVH